MELFIHVSCPVGLVGTPGDIFLVAAKATAGAVLLQGPPTPGSGFPVEVENHNPGDGGVSALLPPPQDAASPVSWHGPSMSLGATLRLDFIMPSLT